MTSHALPAGIGAAAFDALHDDLPAWRAVVCAIAGSHGGGPVRQMGEGTVLVALLGQDRVLKLYPPFLRDHFTFECAALQRLAGRLSVPTPRLLATGEREGWPYLLMTQLAGVPLTAVWPGLDEDGKCALLAQLGALAAQVHALPVAGMAQHAPCWADFIAAQRSRCAQRQRRTGLPEHLLLQLDGFLAGDLPQGNDVILTGEYTPMNLLHGPAAAGARAGLSGMFDFGDGLVGPPAYDWLGPLCFLAAGHAARCQAFFAGYGVVPDAAQRQALLRLLLLHRYSHLQAQIAMKDWQAAGSYEELAARMWP